MRIFAPLGIAIGALSLVPSFALAFEYDASISQGSISYSENQLYAGELVRVYGTIVNRGTKDISGVVRFFQGAVGIGEPLPFSLKAGSANEELWTDWRPSEGTYNLMMTIVSTNPGDENPDNNTAVTPMVTIVKRPPPPPPPAPIQPVTPQPSGASSAPSGTVTKTPVGSTAKKQATPTAQGTAAKKVQQPKVRQEASKTSTEPPRVSVAQKVGEPTFYDQNISAQQQNPPSEFVPVAEQDENNVQPVPKKQEQQSPPWGLAALILLSVGALGAGVYFWKHSTRGTEGE